jgi:hypothetical protein
MVRRAPRPDEVLAVAADAGARRELKGDRSISNRLNASRQRLRLQGRREREYG